MKLNRTLAASVLLCLASSPALADTFVGKIAFKNAAGNIVAKDAEVELTPTMLDKLKLKIAGVENLSAKVKFKVMQTENRKVVLALFRDIRNMPEGSTLILKGSMIEGKNGRLFYGDVLTRSCSSTAREMIDADAEESRFLERLLEGIQTVQDLTGCSTEYRGGVLLARKVEGSQQ